MGTYISDLIIFKYLVLEFVMKQTTLRTINSPLNGELKVISDPQYGVYISGGGLDQSGRAVEIIWTETVKEIAKLKQDIGNVLILGLGGGSVAKLIRQKWPKAEIIGVDMDPVIVELGKKYMGLGDLGVDIHIKDAYDYVSDLVIASEAQQSSDPKNKIASSQTSRNDIYDLICVDTYVGDQFPEKFESRKFLENVKKLLTGHSEEAKRPKNLNPNKKRSFAIAQDDKVRGGLAVFNRTYHADFKQNADIFGEKLSQVYSNVDTIYPELNAIYICKP